MATEATERPTYDGFAWIYNRYWNTFTRDFIPVIEQIVLKQLQPGMKVLDLCCGTGTFTAYLVKKGYDVVGLDQSEGMLAYAQQKAPEARFVHADAESFELDDSFQVCFSTYDSLNHIPTLNGLQQTFNRVHQHLTSPGLFVFDLGTEDGFIKHWNHDFFVNDPDCVVLVRGQYDKTIRKATMNIVGFRQVDPEFLSIQESNVWMRQDHQIVEHFYPEDFVRSGLMDAGFRNVEVMPTERFGFEGRKLYLAAK